MKQKLLNFELLRILCITGIVTMHVFSCVWKDYDYLIASDMINSLFNSCVSLFILISGYFKIKFDIKKIAKYWLMLFFISTLTLLFKIILKQNINIRNIISYIFPLLSNNRWFLTCYILLCFFAPFINEYIDEKLSKNKYIYIYILLIFFVFYYLAPTVLRQNISNDYGKGFMNILFLYFLGRYIGIFYDSDISNDNTIFHKIKQMCTTKEYYLFLFALIYILIFSLNFILSLLFKRCILIFAQDNSMLILIQSIFIFFIFKEITINNKAVLYVSKYTFSIFLYQPFVTETLFPILNKTFLQKFTIFVQIIIFILYIFFTIVICINIELLRNLLFKKFDIAFCKSAGKIFNKLTHTYFFEDNSSL